MGRDEDGTRSLSRTPPVTIERVASRRPDTGWIREEHHHGARRPAGDGRPEFQADLTTATGTGSPNPASRPGPRGAEDGRPRRVLRDAES